MMGGEKLYNKSWRLYNKLGDYEISGWRVSASRIFHKGQTL